MEPHVPTTEQVMEVLASVEDPEINKPITELGMVEDIAIEGPGSASRSSSRSPGVRSRTASPTTSPPR
jgi:ATP-binding protein involved in chromosome partitioning